MTRTLRENSLEDRKMSRLGHAQEGQSTLRGSSNSLEVKLLFVHFGRKRLCSEEGVCVTNCHPKRKCLCY